MKDPAVSPVIGILLMLVVTIIIAAVVSGFAGGLAGSQDKAPQASIIVAPHINSMAGTSSGYPADYHEENNYLLFEHKGGEGFNLDDVVLQFQNGGTKYSIRPGDHPTNLTKYSCREDALADPLNCTYLEEIGDSDGYIKSGDKFKFIFDGNREKSGQLLIYKLDALGSFPVYLNKNTDYMIIDIGSGKAIQTGSFSATR